MGVIINGWEDAPKPFGNRLYHNTFLDNGTDETNAYASAVMITNWGQSQVNISDNVLKNNIICRNNAQKHQLFFYIFPDWQFGEQFYRSYMVSGNVVNQRPLMDVIGLEGSQRIGHYQQRYSNFVRDNMEAEPLFVDKAAGNYRLKDGSPGIDAGVPLTKTKTGGNGTVVSVEDASYFSDGFGLVAGDQVKIGANPPVEVVDVNVDRDTLTFARTIRWSQGDAVYLGEFNGRAPDIGAYESSGAPPPPSLRVLSPNGGEQWKIGDTVTIRWNSSNITGAVNIELSRDGGNRFTSLMTGAMNDGEESWLVSGATTTRAVLRISSANALSVNDSSDAVFSIAPAPPPPVLRMLSPNGGEQWRIGEVVTIRWDSSNVTGAVNIELSRDGGRSFIPLVTGAANDGEESWLVNGAATSSAVLRISSANALSVNDSSDAMFSITEPSSLRVLSPNGGEQWELGHSQTIEWTSAGITGNVMIRYSRDGGRTYRTIFKSIPNTGSVSWKPNGLASTRCLIEVVSVNDGSIRDQSDAQFGVSR
jgi:hypothetical protein